MNCETSLGARHSDSSSLSNNFFRHTPYTTISVEAKGNGLALLMSMLRAGEPVVVWRLDQLARSLNNLIELVERFKGSGGITVQFPAVQLQFAATKRICKPD